MNTAAPICIAFAVVVLLPSAPTALAEDEARACREDAEARTFYPLEIGGGVRNNVHVEADELVGVHRAFDPQGQVVRRIDLDAAPREWSGTANAGAPVAAPDTAPGIAETPATD